MSVKRFRLHVSPENHNFFMPQTEGGEYVLPADYAKLQKKNEELERELAYWRKDSGR